MLEYAEGGVLLLGLALLISLATTFRRTGFWKRPFPPGPGHQLSGLDVLAALLVTMFIPPYVVQSWMNYTDPPPAVTQAGDLAESEFSSDSSTSQLGDDSPVESDVTAAIDSDEQSSPEPDPRRQIPLMVGYLLAVVLLLILIQVRFDRGIVGQLFTGISTGRILLWSAAAYLAVWPLCWVALFVTNFLHELIFPDAVIPVHSTLTLLNDANVAFGPKAATVAVALLLAPLIEEIYFRGILQTALARWLRSDMSAIFFSGLIFGWVHMVNYNTVPALVIFGCVLGYLYARTRSLMLPIMTHVIFNAKTLLWLALGADPSAG